MTTRACGGRRRQTNKTNDINDLAAVIGDEPRSIAISKSRTEVFLLDIARRQHNERLRSRVMVWHKPSRGKISTTRVLSGSTKHVLSGATFTTVSYCEQCSGATRLRGGLATTSRWGPSVTVRRERLGYVTVKSLSLRGYRQAHWHTRGEKFSWKWLNFKDSKLKGFYQAFIW